MEPEYRARIPGPRAGAVLPTEEDIRRLSEGILQQLAASMGYTLFRQPYSPAAEGCGAEGYAPPPAEPQPSATPTPDPGRGRGRSASRGGRGRGGSRSASGSRAAV
jgi:hypothetical protein